MTTGVLNARHLPAALIGSSAYIAGTTGCGKTHLLDRFAEHVIDTGAGVVWRLSLMPSGDTDAAPDWEVFHGAADGTADTKAMLHAAIDVMYRRNQDAASRKLHDHDGVPLYLLADDIFTLTEDDADQLAMIARMGRKTRVYVLVTSHSPFPRHALRDMCPTHVLGASSNVADFMVMFPSAVDPGSRSRPNLRGEFDVSTGRRGVVTRYRPDAPAPTVRLDQGDIAAAGEHYTGRSKTTTAKEAA